MRVSYYVSAVLGLLLSACEVPPVPPPTPEDPVGEGAFQTDQDVNGINPNNATNSIFGVFKSDEDGDGVFDQTVLEIFTSSQADICTRVGLGEFDGIDFPEGVHVDLFVVIQDDFTGGTIDINSAFILSATVLSKTNGVVDLVAASDFVAPSVTINLDTFDLEDGAIGSVTATLTEDASVSPPAVINVALTGTFEATHCQNLSTLLSQ